MNERFVHGHAVVVGVGADLPNTVDGAVALAGILRDPARCAYPPEQVHTLTGERATRDAFLSALDALARSTDPQSTVIVYFAGHGCRVASPIGEACYLVTHGCDLDRLVQTAVSGAEFADRLRAIPAHKLLLLLDCCHAGAVGEAQAPGLQLARSPLPPEARRLLDEGDGRVLVASSREDELSFGGRPYSAFTLALIEAFSGVGVARQDGYIRVADLALHAREVVPGRTGGRQHPILHFEHADNFRLAFYASGDTQPKELPFAVEPEIEPQPGAWRMGEVPKMGKVPRMGVDLHGQTIHGPQTAVTGDARGPILSGEFGGPVALAGGEAVDLRGAQHVIYKPTIQQAPALEIAPPPQPVSPPETPGFIGREAELAYFGDKLATSHLAVICGMPGVGKTALASVLARRVGDPRRTFWHAFHESEGVEGVVWKLAGFLCWHGQADLWHMLQSAQQSGGQPPPPAMLFDYLFQMLRGHGYLLCFDDLQFVEDDPLLEGFFKRTRPALLAGDLASIVTSQCVPAFVDADEFDPLAGLSLEDTRSLFAHHGFPVAEAEDLQARVYSTITLFEMQDLMTADLAANLHARTGGNALFLTQAVDAFKHTEAPMRLLKHLFETDDIERFLVEEIDDSLTENERSVMCALAVLQGHAGTRDAIEAILDGENVRRTLRDLRTRHLLLVSEGEAGREYGMNAIVRYFYYDLLSKRERQAMHRRAGEYYEAEEPDVLRAARHFQEAGEHGRAAQLATASIWTMINRGQAQALHRLLERFAVGQMDAELWARVKIALGEVNTWLGQSQPARANYLEALAQLAQPPGSLADSTGGIQALRHLRARACRGMGDSLEFESPPQALDWLRRGLDELAGTSALEEAALHIKIGNIQADDVGDLAAALRSLERGLSLLPEGPSRLRATALLGLGNIHASQGDIQQAGEYTSQALEISEHLHDYFRMAAIWHNQGIDYEIVGHWDQAVAKYQEALALAERLGSVERQVGLRQSLGVIRTKQGQHEAAMTHLASCLKMARDHNLHVYVVWGDSSLADLHLRQGEPEAAASVLAEAERLALAINTKEPLPEIHREWAQMHLASADPQAASEHAERSVDLARELEMKLEEGMSLRVLAQVLLDSGQPEAALEAFAQSLSLLEAKDPYEAARTRLEWGRALISEPRVPGSGTRQGITLLQEARATFERLGARHDLRAVDELLEMQERGRP